MGINELSNGVGGTGCGVYSVAELEARGWDRNRRRRAVADGVLTPLRRGWFAEPGHDPEVARAVRAGGTLACVSVLRKAGFWVPPGYPGVHVRRGRATTADPLSCRGFTRMDAGETAVDPVVTALECAARCMSGEDWIAVCDSVQNRHGVSAETLRGAMGRLPAKAVALFAKTDGRSQSGTESLCRVRLRSLGFGVIVQPEIPGVGRVDLRIGRLLIECDGEQYHSGRDEFRNDRRRDRASLLGGWYSMRFTYDDIVFGWDDAVADIRAFTSVDRHRIRDVRQ
ncbi:MAG: hypothetical protein QM774_12780 [Gordonia sp. (in: high G+C Gram-positive bacteria)]|uniref:endonuclease domain-containing protein n=1 Tax=Gordonia sp. (in: high G+C Gram-positive bacteria) TaxID=84139 RepID=UPI0039E4B7EC